MEVYIGCIGLQHPDSAESHSKFLLELMTDLSYASKNSNLNINDLKYMQIEDVNPEIINQNELKVIKFFGQQGNQIV
jgi:hypothetical protein